MSVLQNEELQFAETMEKVVPLLNKINELLAGGRINLKNQQFRMDSNHQIIVGQEKQIAENKALIADANAKAASIISVAEDRAKEIDNGIRTRMAEINHLEREAKKKLESSEKVAWEAGNKKAVKV